MLSMLSASLMRNDRADVATATFLFRLSRHRRTGRRGLATLAINCSSSNRRPTCPALACTLQLVFFVLIVQVALPLIENIAPR
jgi:hypothetical protein